MSSAVKKKSSRDQFIPSVLDSCLRMGWITVWTYLFPIIDDGRSLYDWHHWHLPFRWLQVVVAEYTSKAHIIYTITCEGSQWEVSIYQGMKILFHKNFQDFCLLFSWPQANHQASLMFSHIGNCYFPVENMSTFIQKGIYMYELENKWMRTPYYVGNSV